MRWTLVLALAIVGIQVQISPAQPSATQDMRFAEKAKMIAALSAAKIGCRPLNMILDENAFRGFVNISKEKAIWEGIGEAEAISIMYAAEQSEKKSVEASGGDLIKVEGSATKMARYTEYWRATCASLKADPTLSKFFISRDKFDRTIPPPSTPRHSGPMCYKDYCPCQGKQSSIDMMLCDRLEEGLDVDLEMMISARSLRQAEKEMGALR